MIATFIGAGKWAELDDLNPETHFDETLRIRDGQDGPVLIELTRNEVYYLVDFVMGRMVPK